MTVVPTHMIPFKHITVAPIFSEEWHIRPPTYDIYTNKPSEPAEKIRKIEDPRDYPYGQYLTNLNVLPSEEKFINLFCDKKGTAIGYVNSNFVLHDIKYREDMTAILKDKLARQFRHECNDTFSPYHSF